MISDYPFSLSGYFVKVNTFFIFSILFFLLLGISSVILLSRKNVIVNLINVPLFVSMGLILFAGLSIILGLTSIHAAWYIAITAMSLGVILSGRNRISVEPIKDGVVPNVVSAALVLLTFFLYWAVGHIVVWPPAGDVTFAHGPLVQQISVLGRLPLEQSSLGILYPPGLHLLCVSLNILYGFSSPTILFNVALIISSLLPLLLYQLTYTKTRSILAGMAVFLSFWVTTPHGMDSYLSGPLYNGTYPFLFGAFMLVAYMAALAYFESSGEPYPGPPLLYLVFIAVTLFVYPPFVIVLVLHAMYEVSRLIGQPDLVWAEIRHYRYHMLVLSVTLMGVVIWNGASLFNLVYYITGKFVYNSSEISLIPSESAAYAVNLMVLFFSPLGASSLLVFILGSLNPCIRRSQYFILFFITYVIVLLSGLLQNRAPLLSIFTPMRLSTVSVSLSLPVLLIGLCEALPCSSLRVRLELEYTKWGRLVHFSSDEKRFTFIVVFILAFFAFSPSLVETFSLSSARTPWYVSFYDEGYPDIGAFYWIQGNVPPQAIILNDPTWAGLYAQSMTTAENVFHPYWFHMDRPREQALWQIWDDPYDETGMRELLNLYDVDYVYLTSQQYFITLTKGQVVKKFAPFTYAQVFDSYTFLRPVYAVENVRVYAVLPP